MKRRLLNLLAALYFLLFSLTAFGWARETIPFLRDTELFNAPLSLTRYFELDVQHGAAILRRHHFAPNPFYNDWEFGGGFTSAGQETSSKNWHGFVFRRIDSEYWLWHSQWQTTFEYGIPAWLACLLALTAAIVALRLRPPPKLPSPARCFPVDPLPVQPPPSSAA